MVEASSTGGVPGSVSAPWPAPLGVALPTGVITGIATLGMLPLVAALLAREPIGPCSSALQPRSRLMLVTLTIARARI
ncbi:MAG TPA: hypothetical protein VMF89_01030, partial [Polyangiales bacterium]|nr:hypothetical protein [Polyangiales bacterium]